jgi:hypothetical protein
VPGCVEGLVGVLPEPAGLPVPAGLGVADGGDGAAGEGGEFGLGQAGGAAAGGERAGQRGGAGGAVRAGRIGAGDARAGVGAGAGAEGSLRDQQDEGLAAGERAVAGGAGEGRSTGHGRSRRKRAVSDLGADDRGGLSVLGGGGAHDAASVGRSGVHVMRPPEVAAVHPCPVGV